MATYRCISCTGILEREGATCVSCGSAQAAEPQLEIVQRAQAMEVSTTNSLSENVGFVTLGLVFGTSSKQAFWGLSTQADRLTRAYDVALANLKFEAAGLGADAVIAITFALNNSTGSGNALLTGSSEAVMLLGTAVRRSDTLH